MNSPPYNGGNGLLALERHAAFLPGLLPAFAPMALLTLLLLAGCGERAEEGHGDNQSGAKGPASIQEDHKTGQDGRKELVSSDTCPLGEAVATDGRRKLALLVGIGDYRSPAVNDLSGTVGDAKRMYALLTGKGGYGFPKENVCLLLDGAATTDRFKTAFEETLVKRARAGDEALLYFAGHGSQARDVNGDEPDEFDETLLLQDARSDGVQDLLDDELNRMLTRLHAKTERITMILDSCNSGSADRGDRRSGQSRYQPPAESSAMKSGGNSDGMSDADSGSSGVGGGAGKDSGEAGNDNELAGDGGESWAPESLTGLTTLSAAGDGTQALEMDGEGIFTSALVHVLSTGATSPLTYAQVARRVRPLVSARSYQIPYFQGALDRHVFGSTTGIRPIGWDVVEVGEDVKLSGPPLPGWTAGAELLVYDGAVTAEQARDLNKAKANLVLDSSNGISGTASPLTPKDLSSIAVGDIVTLVRPGKDVLKIKVRLAKGHRADAIPTDRAAAIKAAVAKNKAASPLVEWIDDPDLAVYELALDMEKNISLRGPEGRTRNVISRKPAEGVDIAEVLWQHARQQALLQLEGQAGDDFVNNETLRIQLVPYKKQSECARGPWTQAPPNSKQIIPLCKRWKIKITLSEASPTKLLVGGLILSNDGASYGFPDRNLLVRLEPGKSTEFPRLANDYFSSEPPIGVLDHILVFGTREDNPVHWGQFSSTFIPRDVSSLQDTLGAFLDPKGRAVKRGSIGKASSWTSSHLSMQVEANPSFAAAGSSSTGTGSSSTVAGSSSTGTGSSSTVAGSSPPSSVYGSREYTIPSFDIRPYLPENPDASLYKVLRQADWLAKYDKEVDGVPYHQHDWSKATDKENLALGIDCSRSIWFAFTRADLPYTKKNGYVWTGGMVGAKSQMATYFDSCQEDPSLQTGDVLVYRDEARGVGHVVMVIDAEKRIAWGSHGWDGNTREGLEADKGVEYQLIKYKKDWNAWDRKSMTRKACWRHKNFVKEGKLPGNRPGSAPLGDVCEPKRKCGKDVD